MIYYDHDISTQMLYERQSDVIIKWRCKDGERFSLKTELIVQFSQLITDLNDEFGSQIESEGVDLTEFPSAVLLGAIDLCAATHHWFVKKNTPYTDYKVMDDLAPHLSHHMSTSSTSIIEIINLMKYLQIYESLIAHLIITTWRVQKYGYAGLLLYCADHGLLDKDLNSGKLKFDNLNLEDLNFHKLNLEDPKHQTVVIQLFHPLLNDIDKINSYCQSKAQSLIDNLNQGLKYENFDKITPSDSINRVFGFTKFEDFIVVKWLIDKYQLTFSEYECSVDLDINGLVFGTSKPKVIDMMKDLLSETSIVTDSIKRQNFPADIIIRKLPETSEMYYPEWKK